MEKTGCGVTCGATTTLAVKRQVLIMTKCGVHTSEHADTHTYLRTHSVEITLQKSARRQACQTWIHFGYQYQPALNYILTFHYVLYSLDSVSAIEAITYFFVTTFYPSGFSPMKYSGSFPWGKPAATESRYPTYGACWVFQCFHNPLNLTQITGSLTCTQMLMHATAHGGVRTP